MENYIWKTRIITLGQYLNEIGYGDNFAEGVDHLLYVQGCVTEHYVHTIMFDKHYGKNIASSYTPIKETVPETVALAIQVLLDAHH